MHKPISLKLKKIYCNIVQKIHHQKKFSINVEFSIERLGDEKYNSFFGYYDKTPFNKDNNLVLGLQSKIQSESPIKIGYYDLNNDFRFIHVGQSECWSWQLGTRLQWYPKNENEIICYNRIVDGKYGAVLQNIKTKNVEEKFNCPLYDIDKIGKYGITINFSRLYKYRPGYGYYNFEDETQGQKAPKNDGIYLLDFNSKKVSLILNLDYISKFHPQNSMANADHYLNHLSFSPNSNRFLFLHLWMNGGKRYSRVLTSNIYGDNLHIVEDNMNMSHYAWKSDREVLIHSSSKPYGTKFYLYEDLSSKRVQIGDGQLDRSGHPSYSPDKKYILVDTYPDKYRRQQLLLYTSDGDFVEEIGNFYSPFEFSGVNKCDLHPRWDRHGKSICIDSAMDGNRSMYIIKLNKDI